MDTIGKMEPGRELDLEVALDVMDWQEAEQFLGGDAGAINAGQRVAMPVPRYSTCIADAWAIVEHLQNLFGEGEGYTLTLRSPGWYSTGAGNEQFRTWQAIFEMAPHPPFEQHPLRGVADGEGAAEAIARAALRVANDN